MARKAGGEAQTDLIRWLFENSSEMLLVISPEGRCLLVNPAFTAAMGWMVEDLADVTPFGLLHPDDVTDFMLHVKRLRENRRSENIARVRTKDGAYRWMAGRTEVAADGRMISILRDATDERAQLEKLETTRRSRKQLGATAGIGLWSYDPGSEVIQWSDEMAAMLELPADYPNDAVKIQPFLHPREREQISGVLMSATRAGQSGQLEHRLRAGKRWITVRTTYHTVAQASGRYALRGISEDITELTEARDAARQGERQMRRAQREAQASARRLKMALEVAEAGVYEIDHVNRSFWCSPEFERLTGRKESSYEEATQLRYPGFHPDDLPHVRGSFRALHRGNKKSGESFEARIMQPDGSERWVRVFHHLKVGRNGRWLKAVGLIQDCDTRKRQELALIEAQRAAESAGEAKSSFLANMSHEIRTPMNGVMGVLHLLQNEQLSEEAQSLLNEALSCGRMLNELLNDVIDFSKIEAGRLELNNEPLEVVGLVRGVARLLGAQAEAKALPLIVDVDPQVGWVRADPVRLRQALFNLVGNAVKFTHRGRVVIRARMADAGVLRFEVEDTGVGIADEAQAKLFERFNQGDASTTRKFGGSGLGLAITKRLAELMNGDVGFVSVEGQGTTFWMEIAAEPAEATEDTVEAESEPLAGLSVLVVEDNPTNRLIATKLLEQLGADVETAEDGYLGVEAAARGGFDLILMDVQMPGIDGVEAARRIRALGGLAGEAPIVALTANVLAHQRQSYLDAGMDGVVGKPISPGALLAELARISGEGGGSQVDDEASELVASA
jgi:PAS domain S-box-containing protein